MRKKVRFALRQLKIFFSHCLSHSASIFWKRAEHWPLLVSQSSPASGHRQSSQPLYEISVEDWEHCLVQGRWYILYMKFWSLLPAWAVMRFLSEFVSGFTAFCPPRVMLFHATFWSCPGELRGALVCSAQSAEGVVSGESWASAPPGEAPWGARGASPAAAALFSPPQCSCQKASRGGGFPSDARGGISGVVQEMCRSSRGRGVSRLHRGLQSGVSGRRPSCTRQ